MRHVIAKKEEHEVALEWDLQESEGGSVWLRVNKQIVVSITPDGHLIIQQKILSERFGITSELNPRRFAPKKGQ